MDAIFSEAHMDVRLQRPVRYQYITMLYLENTAANEQFVTHIDTQKCFKMQELLRKFSQYRCFANAYYLTKEKGDIA